MPWLLTVETKVVTAMKKPWESSKSLARPSWPSVDPRVRDGDGQAIAEEVRAGDSEEMLS
jgi:hypothetical protein